MLHPTLHFLLFTGIKGPRIRAAQIAADPPGNGDARRIVVAAIRTGEAAAGTGELAVEAALVALINRGISAVIGHAVVAVIPDILQRLQISKTRLEKISHSQSRGWGKG